MKEVWIIETSKGFVYRDNEETGYYLGGSGVYIVGFNHRKEAQKLSKKLSRKIKGLFAECWHKTVKVKVLK